MKRILVLVSGALLAGCASFNGSSLVPGASTAAQAEALMGPPAQQLSLPNGDMAIYFSRLPQGRAMYVVTVGPDGIMKSIEQRLTQENLAKLIPGTWTRKEVRELFGPPGDSVRFARLQREVWSYKYFGGHQQRIIYVQFSDDGVVREVMDMIDPADEMKRTGQGWS